MCRGIRCGAHGGVSKHPTLRALCGGLVRDGQEGLDHVLEGFVAAADDDGVGGAFDDAELTGPVRELGEEVGQVFKGGDAVVLAFGEARSAAPARMVAAPRIVALRSRWRPDCMAGVSRLVLGEVSRVFWTVNAVLGVACPHPGPLPEGEGGRWRSRFGRDMSRVLASRGWPP